MSNLFFDFSTNEARDFHHMTSKRSMPAFLLGILDEAAVDSPKNFFVIRQSGTFHEVLQLFVNFIRLFGKAKHQPYKQAKKKKCSSNANHKSRFISASNHTQPYMLPRFLVATIAED